jgi:hypothetical protein
MKTKYDIKLRRRSDRLDASNEEAQPIRRMGILTELQHGNYHGLRVNGYHGVPAIYDSINFSLSVPIGVVEIDKEFAIIDIYKGELLTDFCYDQVEFMNGNQTALLRKKNMKGLFDIIRCKEIFAPVYDDISIRAGFRYAWTYSSTEGYCYIDTQTRKRISLGKMPDECFDETYENIFIIKGGKVQLINSDGISDEYMYRKLLSSLGGRIKLNNSAHGVSVIADIYGCIL